MPPIIFRIGGTGAYQNRDYALNGIHEDPILF
ncbi:hypothetical protein J2S14_000575 [Lederbergia wuyishanensis]|uniref:Uncharacterized protein n=1 Tax=Lederbergia wuyishanensis TaxID=1347903 RepID=A0ABU0D047_9BACI|nr:hypothetical protein [Lederbergia wuyishanensis]